VRVADFSQRRESCPVPDSNNGFEKFKVQTEAVLAFEVVSEPLLQISRFTLQSLDVLFFSARKPMSINPKRKPEVTRKTVRSEPGSITKR
jgi:hypothetical protein